MRTIALLLALLFALPAWSREIVRVGGYEFSPYVEVQNQQPTGLTAELLKALNQIQDRYDFQFEFTSPRRRYEDFSNGRFDVIFFESPDWGWSKRQIKFTSSREILRDSEVFVALAAPGRGEHFFTSLSGHTIAGVYGYHYAFAGYDDDPDMLEQDFRMSLVYSNYASLQLVLGGRTELAIVTRSYLDRFLHTHPKEAPRLLISKRVDQVYSLRALVSDKARISADQIDALIAKLRQRGTLDQLRRAAGITH